jgi:hypothetical protein
MDHIPPRVPYPWEFVPWMVHYELHMANMQTCELMIHHGKRQGRNRGRYRILKHKHIPELAHKCNYARLVPQCIAQSVTNNAHAICTGRRMASYAMQWHIIDAACRQLECDMMRCKHGGLFAESRHSGMRNANHGWQWQFFRLGGWGEELIMQPNKVCNFASS